MSKRELNSLLATLLPYVHGEKQATALFTVVLLLGLSHGAFDAPHLHVEPAPLETTATVTVAASGTIVDWSSYDGDVPMIRSPWDIGWDIASRLILVGDA